jgi:hypothetical protein
MKKQLKIYKISQKVNNDYDTFDAVIVVAESEEEARMMNPYGDTSKKLFSTFSPDSYTMISQCWAPELKYVKVKYIGEAGDKMKKGVVLASYRAG